MSLDEKIMRGFANHKRRTVGSIAKDVGESVEAVQDELDRMIQRGIVSKGISKGAMLYRKLHVEEVQHKPYVPSYVVKRMQRFWAGTPWQGMEGFL